MGDFGGILLVRPGCWRSGPQKHRTFTLADSAGDLDEQLERNRRPAHVRKTYKPDSCAYICRAFLNMT